MEVIIHRIWPFYNVPAGIRQSLLLVYLLVVTGSVAAQVNQDKLLFYIERNKDRNRIYYEANETPSGKLDQDHPIKIYWLKEEGQGKTAPLTWVQKRLAYGLDFYMVSDSVSAFQFVSYKDRTLHLRKSEKGYKVYLQTSSGPMELSKIFVNISGGTFLFPKIAYVQLIGISPKSGTYISEKILP